MSAVSGTCEAPVPAESTGSALAHPEFAAEVVDRADLGALHLLEGGFELDQEAGAGGRVPAERWGREGMGPCPPRRDTTDPPEGSVAPELTR